MSAINLATQRKTIMCVGMCVLDIIHICEEYPPEDSDKRCLDGYWQRGGNASNNCTVLRQLGAQCEFLGMLSDAPAFTFLQEDCQKHNIQTVNCPHVSISPPFSSVILSNVTGTRTIVHANPNFPILTFEHFDKHIDLHLYKWIHFEARNPAETLLMLQKIDNFNATRSSCDDAVIVSVDLEKLKLENLILAQLADYVFLGKELAKYLGWSNKREAVFGLRNKLQTHSMDNSRKSNIICTWGAKGVSSLDTNDNYAEVVPQVPKRIVDSLGAGDTFCAATIHAMANLKFNLKDATQFGNQCAAYKLEHRGYDAIGKYSQQLSN